MYVRFSPMVRRGMIATLIVIMAVALMLMSGCSQKASNDSKKATEESAPAQTVEQQAPAEAPVDTTHPISFTIAAPEYLDATCTRIPVRVVGTTTEGEAVDENAYLSLNEQSLSLKPGTYTISVIASPLLATGDLYALPENNAIDFTVPADLATGAVFAVSPETPIVFALKDAASVTDEQIDAAYNAAKADEKSADKADALRDLARAHRDDAVAVANTVIHVDTDYYSFDMPGTWGGTVVESETVEGGLVTYVDSPYGNRLIRIAMGDDIEDGLDSGIFVTFESGTTSEGEKVIVQYNNADAMHEQGRFNTDQQKDVNDHLTESARDKIRTSFQTK